MCNMLLLISAGVAAAPLVGSQQFATLLVSFCLLDCCTTQFAGLPVMSCLLTLQAEIHAIALLLSCMHDSTHCWILVQPYINCMVVPQGYVILAGSCVRSFPQVVRMSKNKRCSLTSPMDLPCLACMHMVLFYFPLPVSTFAALCCMVVAPNHLPSADVFFQLICIICLSKLHD